MRQVVRYASEQHFWVGFCPENFWNNTKGCKTLLFFNRTFKRRVNETGFFSFRWSRKRGAGSSRKTKSDSPQRHRERRDHRGALGRSRKRKSDSPHGGDMVGKGSGEQGVLTASSQRRPRKDRPRT